MTTVRWSIVVPVKPVGVAKSRLRALPGPLRAEIVVAMAADTVTAAVASLGVAAVYVVTDDPMVARAVEAAGACVLADEPEAGLNAALGHGAAIATRNDSGCAVAALAADLPALSPVELRTALIAAARHRRALMPDAAGTGTTLLTALPGVPLEPSYGADSRRRHLAAGAVELTIPGCEGLRRDVDTIEDLVAAERIGLGRRTRTALGRRAAGVPAAE